jgi:polygalacturonase
MTTIDGKKKMRSLRPLALLCALALASACDDASTNSVSYEAREPFQVGTTTFDADLPAEPQLPTAAQVCATLEASNKYVKRPDGALPPEADASPAGTGVAADPAVVNPDQARIQAALDACGAAVDLEVGAAIADADAAAQAAQVAAALPNVNLAGATGEELAKPMYRASKYAVRLVASSTGSGNGFISGPLTIPSGVTLWIDQGVTLFATRDVMPYSPSAAGPYCANTAVSATKAGSSGNCTALFNGNNLVNSAIVGDGSIDSRAYAEIVTSNKLYPLLKVDLTCSNTIAAYSKGTQAADGTPCDDGGTFVDSKASSRNMTWWDLAWLGNMVENGRTGVGSQSNFRMMVFNYAKNLTLYRITMNNSANFHFVPAGIDGLTVWGVKLQTPSLAAYANPAGNMNPLYTGDLFGEDNVKNTDAFDPGSASKPALGKLTTGSKTTSTGSIAFDGYLKNVVFAYNHVSTGDDDIVLKGSNNPSPAGSGLPGIDGNRDVRKDRKYGITIAHNHIYWGHGISIGSETNAGVRNVYVYDNSFNGSEEALRIKSDYARGGEVSNVYYDRLCVRDTLNSLLFTPYYSTKALPAAGPLFPNFHDIYVSNMLIEGATNVRLQGFTADTGGLGNPQYPLVMSLTNVVSLSPAGVSVLESDANLTLRGVNLPLYGSDLLRVNLTGTPTLAVDANKVVDCSRAYVDFPSTTSPAGSSW